MNRDKIGTQTYYIHQCTNKDRLMYMACLYPNLVSVHFYAIPISLKQLLHGKHHLSLSNVMILLTFQPHSQALYTRGKSLVHTACACAQNPGVLILMCYHGDLVHGQAVCTRPSPLVYIGPGNKVNTRTKNNAITKTILVAYSEVQYRASTDMYTLTNFSWIADKFLVESCIPAAA